MVTTQLVSGNIGSKVRQAVKKANDTYLAEINTTHFSPSAYNANQKAMLALNFVLKFSQVVVYGGKGYTWGWEHWPPDVQYDHGNQRFGQAGSRNRSFRGGGYGIPDGVGQAGGHPESGLQGVADGVADGSGR